ncbi:carotenoid oxygenase family protein, partial [Verminephrobacter eiseniae]
MARSCAQFLVEEHVFVPDGAQPGWIRGTALDFVQRTTVLSCFAADDLAAGPVAQARLPYALPPGLHGAFVPAWGETPSARCRRRRLTGPAAGRACRAEARID